jgi:hypothetical protein
MITNEQMLKELAKFFIEEFNNNPSDIGDWLAQGDYDVDEFYKKAEELSK